MSEQKVRVLEFGPYDPAQRISADQEFFAAPSILYVWVRASLEYGRNQPGDKERRKRLKGIKKKVRQAGEWIATGEVDAAGYPKLDWRLIPAGTKPVLLTQAELDLVRELWTVFAKEVAIPVEVSVEVDDFLENVPERVVTEE